jgi:hypothetical protein
MPKGSLNMFFINFQLVTQFIMPTHTSRLVGILAACCQKIVRNRTPLTDKGSDLVLAAG